MGEKPQRQTTIYPILIGDAHLCFCLRLCSESLPGPVIEPVNRENDCPTKKNLGIAISLGTRKKTCAFQRAKNLEFINKSVPLAGGTHTLLAPSTARRHNKPKSAVPTGREKAKAHKRHTRAHPHVQSPAACPCSPARPQMSASRDATCGTEPACDH